jgi:16S rRNA (guanine527-N7)-methyltransferase
VNPSDNIRVINPAAFLEQTDPDNRLAAYFDLLRSENRKINLVSRETLGPDSGDNASLQALAAESLLPLVQPEIGNISRYLDIGSGGGFPALPIMIIRQPDHAMLVERTQKKAGALRRILIGLGLTAAIEARSFDELTLDTSFDLVTLRLVKLNPRLLKAILRYLDDGAFLVYYSRPEFDPASMGAESTTYYYTIGSDTTKKCFTLLKKV